jgi:catechol 2,3-dioxygenase-like lactoylglutathione lyase family enzyme
VKQISLTLALTTLAGCAGTPTSQTVAHHPTESPAMSLGNFSVSLAVKNLAVSRDFYEKLGFRAVAGDGTGYLILQNDTATIGLFQGMFEKNMLTFNPGWDRTCATLADFDDVRQIQRAVVSRGLTPVVAADESTTGPASLMLVDPDGNPILLDQHVPSPGN